ARKNGRKSSSGGGGGLGMKRMQKRRRLLEDGECDSGCASGDGVIRVCDPVCSG
ncbi:unnamed protein product, partial [Laminaria digitata]